MKDVSLKASWTKIIYEDVQMSKIAEKMLIPQLGSMIFKCNINEKDIKWILQETTDPFWRDMITAWCRYNYEENKSVCTEQPIWFNSHICIADRPIFIETASRNGLNWVYQLYKDGKCISAIEALKEYGLAILDYNKIISAIPKEARNQMKLGQRSKQEYTSKYQKIIENKHPSGTIYKDLNSRGDGILSKKVQQWNGDLKEKVNVQELKRRFLQIHGITNIVKYRSFQYRLLHRAIVTNKHLYRWGMIGSNMCTFCDTEGESYTHLFHRCTYVKDLWEGLTKFTKKLTGGEMKTNEKDVLMNTFHRDAKHLANIIGLIAKQYIYRQRCYKKLPRLNECRNIILNVKNSERYIAAKNGKLSKHESKWNPKTVDENRHVEMQNIEIYIEQYVQNM